ncbi:DMT family transporter [Roseibium sp. RKSG952]|uniref:DMT family transporter n=1 Tax=Roseibium sp. RKSG952 TaxID=2529384 RepID=UPI0012BB6B3E|nr:EamA family transporter [Roseibium sp. RKSG952]MTH98372.1 EamA family transporter [Roseibium sp. RKSG952]
MPVKSLEYGLLGLLALAWGSSYLWIDLALQSFPPVTLIAIRVGLAAAFLLAVIKLRGLKLPRDVRIWKAFALQSVLNSTGPWLLLAWGQQYVESAVASVLNSTSPLFVFVLSLLFVKGTERPGLLKLGGALLGFGGILLIVGPGALGHLGDELIPQAAILLGAVLYGGAALRGAKLAGNPPTVTAAGTLICSSLVVIPLSLIVDRPWTLQPAPEALFSVAILGVVCTALAFLLYFRLLGTLGPMGAASQAYLRSGVGVFLGVMFLSEVLQLATFAGICLAISGVVLINWPGGKRTGQNLAGRKVA